MITRSDHCGAVTAGARTGGGRATMPALRTAGNRPGRPRWPVTEHHSGAVWMQSRLA
jgi:hypothetical protein